MAKKELEEDLLAGGSLASEDKSAAKAAKKAEKAAKARQKNDAKKAAIKKEIDALKEQKASETDAQKLEALNKKIKALSDKYSSVGTKSNGLAPRTVKIIKSVICIVIVVALLAAYVCTGTVRKGFVSSIGIPAQHFTGMTVTNGDQKIKLKVATYNYYFAMTYNNLQNTKNQYEQYGLDLEDANLNVDFDKKLSSQKTKNDDGKEVTWAQYVHEEVLESIEDTYTYYLAAVAANDGKEPEITEEQQKEIKDAVAQYKESANKYGYTTSAYLVRAMGKGVTEKIFKQEATRGYIASNYKETLSGDSANTEFSKDDLNAYKDEHKADLVSVDIKYFECDNEDDAKAFKNALNADGSNFTELCAKYADDSKFKADGYSTLYAATKSILSNKGLAIATANDDGKTPGLDWIFSSDRKAGDVKQQSTSVVYIIRPAALSDQKVVNVRHILITPETDEEGADASTATDKQWKAAYDKAKKILDLYNAGEKTEESFSALVADNTMDPGSKDNGGLYENVYPGQMVDPFAAWAFNPARQAGNTGIVRTDYGYHIMFFVGKGDMKTWEYTAQQALAKDDNESKSNKLENDYTLKVNWFGSRYFEKDVDIDN